MLGRQPWPAMKGASWSDKIQTPAGPATLAHFLLTSSIICLVPCRNRRVAWGAGAKWGHVGARGTCGGPA